MLGGVLSALGEALISVVVPTITGREESLARGIESYERTLQGIESEIIVVQNAPTWPSACNYGYEQAKYDIILFSADDLEALPGWFDDIPTFLAERDELPAPRVYDWHPPPEGKFANEEDGPDGALTHFTRIPIMRRDQWERIGKWPEMVYYADLWLSEYARVLDPPIRTRMLYGYDFVHHWSQVGRVDSKENLEESGWQLNRLREQMV